MDDDLRRAYALVAAGDMGDHAPRPPGSGLPSSTSGCHAGTTRTTCWSTSCPRRYHDGRTAQIEDLASLAEHRGRGYASALVLRALEEARQTGCDLVVLVADAEDWPKLLYGRLGFVELGRYVKLIRPG